MGMMAGRKTLEVNANHPVIVDLLAKTENDKEDAASLDTAQVLFQTAVGNAGCWVGTRSIILVGNTSKVVFLSSMP